MSRIIFISGTDTGIGKTWVATALVRALRASGLRVAVRKPAESGCERVDGVLVATDAEALRATAASDETIEVICPLRLAEPLAPGIAARRAGETLDVDAFVVATLERAAEVDMLLVEGAGGLLVPLMGRLSCADLALRLDAELLIVVGARLGAINHALLTEAAALAAGLRILGFVVNHNESGEDLARSTLVEALREFAESPVLAEIGHGSDGIAALQDLLLR